MIGLNYTVIAFERFQIEFKIKFNKRYLVLFDIIRNCTWTLQILQHEKYFLFMKPLYFFFAVFDQFYFKIRIELWFQGDIEMFQCKDVIHQIYRHNE